MSESSLHTAVAKYISLAYPQIIFNTDLSGIKLTKSQAAEVCKLRSSRSFPDLVIYEPSKGYLGLFIELKAENIYKKDGTLKKAPKKVYRLHKGVRLLVEEYDHLAEQDRMLKRLESKGYCARFAVGFREAQKLIDWYLK